jgi:GNAT superfamily N-acetyltransferase
MPDMLVKLFELPDSSSLLGELAARGIVVRRTVSTEQRFVLAWVEQAFGGDWASECGVAFARQPISCFIATERGRIVGFACHDVFAYRDYFGPMGVSEAHRGLRIGRALLLRCLEAMAAQGYAYAIIAWVGPTEFYAKTVGATVIEGAAPPLYQQLLKE